MISILLALALTSEFKHPIYMPRNAGPGYHQGIKPMKKKHVKKHKKKKAKKKLGMLGFDTWI